MVDVGAKPVTEREAIASAVIRMKPETLRLVTGGKVAKGDAFAVARLAGIQAAKQTAALIPLAHPIPVSSVKVELTPQKSPCGVRVEAAVCTAAQTGVEMEALVAASVAALTLYDMCKAVERGMRIERVQLEYKAGGKSGIFTRNVRQKKKSNSKQR